MRASQCQRAHDSMLCEPCAASKGAIHRAYPSTLPHPTHAACSEYGQHRRKGAVYFAPTHAPTYFRHNRIMASCCSWENTSSTKTCLLVGGTPGSVASNPRLVSLTVMLSRPPDSTTTFAGSASSKLSWRSPRVECRLPSMQFRQPGLVRLLLLLPLHYATRNHQNNSPAATHLLRPRRCGAPCGWRTRHGR
jgi:hypothetical protein